MIVLCGTVLAPKRPADERLHAMLERLPAPMFPAGAPPIEIAGELRVPPVQFAERAPDVAPLGSITLPAMRLAETPPAVPIAGELVLAEIVFERPPPDVPLPGAIERWAMVYPAMAPSITAPGEMALPSLALAPQAPYIEPRLALLTPPSGDAAQCRRPAAVTQYAEDSRDFGERIAAAAVAQASDLVVYNPAYRRIAFPGGDVSSLYGVCTDVVVRAYRAPGIDMQALVQGMRRGDPNIDHRRVEVLRTFLVRAGARLAPSADAEAYLPGDIVTYHRPQNRGSTTHIAIVTGVIAPSGRPMIVHNRGWGVQIEDALFVDRITGHYRYHPLPEPSGAIAMAVSRSRTASVSRPRQSPGSERLRTASGELLRTASAR